MDLDCGMPIEGVLLCCALCWTSGLCLGAYFSQRMQRVLKENTEEDSDDNEQVA